MPTRQTQASPALNNLGKPKGRCQRSKSRELMKSERITAIWDALTTPPLSHPVYTK